MLHALAFILGAIIGSFLNVVVIRKGALTLLGRSKCLSCASEIAWHDNIPVFSWLILRGRCRSCGSAISLQYPLVELLSAAIFALALPPLVGATDVASITSIAVLGAHVLAVGFLLAISVYDARHTIIPDEWVYSFSGLALVIALEGSFAPLHITLLSGPIAALPLFALWFLSGGRWMGLGDAKLMLGIGWLLGPYFGIIAIMLASIIGAFTMVCIVIPLNYTLKVLHEKGVLRWQGVTARFTMKSEVAFGPFLVAAFFILWLSMLYDVSLPII